MAVCFKPGTELGRNDLSIFLVNEYGVPVNAAEISYSIYFVDKSKGEPGVEVLIYPEIRTPVNPSVGEYYAALLVPPGASAGLYRIRWKFKKSVDGEEQVVVQEFQVEDPTACTQGQVIYSKCVAGFIDRLRIMLRDNCIAGDEAVELEVGGEVMTLRMEELWDILKDEGTPRWSRG